MTVPTYLPIYVLIGSLAIIGTILLGLRNALTNSAWLLDIGRLTNY